MRNVINPNCFGVKQLPYLLLFLSFYSCTSTKKYIRIHQDGSALVLQEYCQSDWVVKQSRTDLGKFDSEEERKKYDAAIIENFNDTIDNYFSYTIPTLDSIGKYLSCIPEDFISIQKLNDTVYTVNCNMQSNANMGKLIQHFEISFNEPIKSISTSSPWHTRWRKKANRVSLKLNPKSIFKEKKPFSLKVKL